MDNTDVIDRIVRWRGPAGEEDRKVFFKSNGGVWTTTVPADQFLLPVCFGSVTIEDDHFVIRDDLGGAEGEGEGEEIARTPIHDNFDQFVAWCRMVDRLGGLERWRRV